MVPCRSNPTMIEVIYSASNPLIKRIRALANKKERQREQMFTVEGMQPVWRAAESDWAIETLIVSPTAIERPEVAEMAERLERRGSRIAVISGDLFNRLSDRDGPTGVMAIVRMETIPLSTVDVGEGDVWIVLHRVHNPGNLGTILRTADATGCAGVILSGDSTDPFAPVAVKSSMGAVFAVPMVIEYEFDHVRSWAAENGVRLVGTSGTAESAHWDQEWQLPVGIVLGNEGDGLPAEIVDSLDSTVRIPMTGTAESLNLGIAASVMMYEAKRNRIK